MGVIPNYAIIKFRNTSPATQSTSKKAKIVSIKDEIKFLYIKNLLCFLLTVLYTSNMI
jgi:hypothetical protein